MPFPTLEHCCAFAAIFPPLDLLYRNGLRHPDTIFQGSVSCCAFAALGLLIHYCWEGPSLQRVHDFPYQMLSNINLSPEKTKFASFIDYASEELAKLNTIDPLMFFVKNHATKRNILGYDTSQDVLCIFKIAQDRLQKLSSDGPLSDLQIIKDAIVSDLKKLKNQMDWVLYPSGAIRPPYCSLLFSIIGSVGLIYAYSTNRALPDARFCL